MKFKLEKVPGIIKAMKVLTASTVPDKEGHPVKMVGVEFLIEANVTGALKELHSLFPNADVIANMVAGDDDMPGQDVTARGKLGEMAFLIHYGTDKEPVVDVANVQIKSRPQLRIDEKGGAKLIIKPRGKLTAKGMTKAWEMLAADGLVTVVEAQMDIDDLTKEADEKEKAKQGKKEKPAAKAKAAGKGRKPPQELFADDPVPVH